MIETIAWGQIDAAGHQGFAYRGLDRRYWWAHWSGLWNTMERDGPMRTVGHACVSDRELFQIFPFAVVDDFGNLVPVPGPTSPAWPSLARARAHLGGGR